MERSNDLTRAGPEQLQRLNEAHSGQSFFGHSASLLISSVNHSSVPHMAMLSAFSTCTTCIIVMLLGALAKCHHLSGHACVQCRLEEI